MFAFTLLFAYLWQQADIKASNCESVGRKILAYGFAFLTFLPMYLINATMTYVGTDYKEYYRYYTQLSPESTWHMDVAFETICKILKSFNLDFQMVYFVICLIGYVLLLLCIRKYSEKYWQSYFWYFMFTYFFLLGMNLIRQFVAMMIVWYGISYIEEKKFMKYLICVLIATSFHFTAIIMLPFYFIFNKKLKLSLIALATVIAVPINFVFTEVLTWLFKTFKPSYLNSNYIAKSFEIDVPYVGTCLITILLIVLFFNKIYQEGQNGKGKYNIIFVNSVFVGVFIVLFCSWLPIYKRFAVYFLLPGMFLIPNILQNEQRKMIRIALNVLQLLLCLFYLVRYIPHWDVLPYRSMFF